MTKRVFQYSSLLLALISASAVMAVAPGENAKAAASAEEAKPLKVGEALPAVTVTTEEGKEVKLSEALAGQPSAIVFYRGHWCPYCMKHLVELKAAIPQLEELGVKLVAITPDKPEFITEAKTKTELTIDIFSDGMLDAAKAMGVAFQLDEKTADRYRKHLVESTGHDTGQLPVPAVFLTDKEGKITFVFSNPDYKTRLSNEELLAAAKSSKG